MLLVLFVFVLSHLLQNLVSRFGNVKRATIWRCRNTGQSKGFGLVELGDVQQATVAMEGLNHCLLEGSTGPLQVEFNHPKPSKGNTQPGMSHPSTGRLTTLSSNITHPSRRNRRSDLQQHLPEVPAPELHRH